MSEILLINFSKKSCNRFLLRGMKNLF